jgi:hypothetical protein
LIVAQKRKIYNLRQALDEEGRFFFLIKRERERISLTNKGIRHVVELRENVIMKC